jgi:hypothetical protein
MLKRSKNSKRILAANDELIQADFSYFTDMCPPIRITVLPAEVQGPITNESLMAVADAKALNFYNTFINSAYKVDNVSEPGVVSCCTIIVE